MPSFISFHPTVRPPIKDTQTNIHTNIFYLFSIVEVGRNSNDPIIMFDGCECDPSINDAAHLQRTKGIVGAQGNFVGDVPLKSKKEHFLANIQNKQKFIHMPNEKINEKGLKPSMLKGTPMF